MPLTSERIDTLTANMGKSQLLILGDIMLDEYLIGEVERISPEAPVPVVEISSDRMLLGGAANVAANVRALGDRPLLIGTVGEDDAAAQLRELLSAKQISPEYLLVDKTRRTTMKTRIIAHSQQVVRADREDRHDLSDDLQNQVMHRLDDLSDTINAVIISDYGKGVITRALLANVVAWCNKRNIFVAVDPKETNFHNYRQVSLITPNHLEAGFAYGRKISSEEDLHVVGNGLLDKLQARSILITRGSDGMSLFQSDEPPRHIPTFARHVFDVTGAGDTVIATFVSAVCAGASMFEAAILANAGAGQTVGEVGTATVTVAQLREELKRNVVNGRLVSLRK